MPPRFRWTFQVSSRVASLAWLLLSVNILLSFRMMSHMKNSEGYDHEKLIQVERERWGRFLLNKKDDDDEERYDDDDEEDDDEDDDENDEETAVVTGNNNSHLRISDIIVGTNNVSSTVKDKE
jgi:hypothetical protein